jgi:hypothetical protein
MQRAITELSLVGRPRVQTPAQRYPTLPGEPFFGHDFLSLRGGRSLGDRRIFVGSVEPGARQQLHRAAVEARMHAVAVVFDFVEPLVVVGRDVD